MLSELGMLRSTTFAAFMFLIFALASNAPARDSITVVYGRGRAELMRMTLDAQQHLENGDLTGARQLLDAVIQKDTTFYPAYYIRAEVAMQQRRFEDAVRDCDNALRQDSTFAEAALLRAEANYDLGRYSASLREIEHVISIRPRQDAFAEAYRERARLRLHCPDPAFRNNQQAIKDATLACKLSDWRNSAMIDTLALAYAESGDFDSAIRYEERALSEKNLDKEETRVLQHKLESFKQHRLPR
jgi:tetratricopeptide (TPR) repeat protein